MTRNVGEARKGLLITSFTSGGFPCVMLDTWEMISRYGFNMDVQGHKVFTFAKAL